MGFGGQRGEHFVAQLVFAEMPRRGGNVDDYFCTGGDQIFRRILAITPFVPETFVVPNIFADGQADCCSVELNGKIFLRRFKIARFIKDIVSRQQSFLARRQNFSILQECHGVGDGVAGPNFVASDVADRQAGFSSSLRESLQHRQIACHKIFAQQQVARRVAGDGQFGQHDQICSSVHGVIVGGENFFFIACEITDSGVDLRQSNFHPLKLCKDSIGRKFCRS